MMGELWNRIRKKRNNSGAAIVLVIVAIAFIGMLVAMIVYMAFYNYSMKSADRISKDNFYSAEMMLDVLNSGLQQDISDSMAEAYVTTMQDSVGLSETQMTVKFQEEYLKILQEKLYVSASEPLKYKLEHLRELMALDGTTVINTSKNNGFHCVLSAIGDNVLEKKDGCYITLKNLRITCTTSNGYVSIIETDIRLKIPNINYAMATNRLEVENYALIANKRLVNNPNFNDGTADHAGGSTSTTVTGNVFGGNDGIYIKNAGSISFIDDTTDSVSSYYLIANTMNSNNTKDSNGLVVDDKHLNYTSGINVMTGNLNLNGTTFVSDDLTIDGNSCNVKVSGTYYGYGDSLNGSDNSSSILINGANTSLDLSRLNDLSLSGHAYVGARHYDADQTRNTAGQYDNKSVVDDNDEDFFDGSSDYVENIVTYDQTLTDNAYVDTDDSINRNNSDVFMGESISVKANSLMYMIPTDCMGFVAATGEQVLAKNPMTYDDYRELTEKTVKEKQTDGTEKDVPYYQPVNLSNLWARLGGTYTESYKVVFRRVNGTVLAYFYLDFGSNEFQANEFFKAYYAYDKEGLTKYIRSYVPNIKWNTALSNDNNKFLTLAGNAFYFNASGELMLQPDTLNSDTEKLEKAIKNSEEYSDTFNSLMHILKPAISETTTMQQSQSVFDNIVDRDAVNNKLGSCTLKDETDSINAIVWKDDYVYTGDPKIKLIICLGNVYLRNNFDGLVLAGGNIYIGANCKQITYNAADVLKALRTKNSANYYAYEALGDSGTFSYAENTTEATEEFIDLGSLIVYQNWKKE